MRVGVGWFPEPEWERAIERWPHLAEELPVAHDRYRAALESRLRAMQPRLEGNRLGLVALTVEEVEARAAADDVDAGSGEARGRAAAEATRLGRAVPWPPGRNDPCWCGSGEKYKRCCGFRWTTVAPVTDHRPSDDQPSDERSTDDLATDDQRAGS
jgi:hypothetical protein